MATQTLTVRNTFAPPPTTAAKPAPAERVRLYKDFLTPALHKRFTHAAGVAIIVCWFDSWLLSNSSHFIHSWFPLGPAGLRALLLFAPCLTVFIVRVAGMHIGERTSHSAAESVYAPFVKSIGSTLHAFAWYVGSAWFFGEVFIWSRSEKAELALVDPGRAYERPRLNENPIWLRCLFIVVGLLQATLHLVRDYDRLPLPIASDNEVARESMLTRTLGIDISKLPRPARILAERFGSIAQGSFNRALVGIVINMILYFGLRIRYPIWRWTYSFARPLFLDFPPSAPPTGIMHLWKIFTQSISAPTMLVVLWEMSNTAFDIFVAQPPLKKGQPLTSEVKDARGVVLSKSKDPNGSLLTGLRSKKEVVKGYALWELSIICEQFEQRRKTIYLEVDRVGGSTWSQVCECALKEISDIKERIKDANEPAGNKAEQGKVEPQMKPHEGVVGSQQQESSFGLKKIADQTVKNDADVFSKQKPDFLNSLGSMAKSVGQSPGAIDPVSPQARRMIQYATEHALTPEQQQLLQPGRMQQEAHGYLARLLRTQAGMPFRQTFARHARAVIFGTPYSARANLIHAATALRKLCVSSLQEDEYGQVQKDVGTVVRTLTDVIRATEHFLRALPPRWTDVAFTERDRHDVADVRQLLAVLKACLEEILLAFADYTAALGLSRKEVREAREAAAKSQPAPPPPPPSSRPLPDRDARPEMVDLGSEPVGARQRRVYN